MCNEELVLQTLLHFWLWVGEDMDSWVSVFVQARLQPFYTLRWSPSHKVEIRQRCASPKWLFLTDLTTCCLPEGHNILLNDHNTQTNPFMAPLLLLHLNRKHTNCVSTDYLNIFLVQQFTSDWLFEPFPTHVSQCFQCLYFSLFPLINTWQANILSMLESRCMEFSGCER